MTYLLTEHSVTALDVVHHADALAWLRGAPSDWIHCAVTSPPYFQQRDYGVEGQIGLESTPDAYVTRLVTVFRELRRVLRPDGTLWLNIADSYLPGKQLAGVPWRVALALQADGWILRSDCIWHKPNPLPSPVTDRPTVAHEYLFLLARSEGYYYDQVAAAEPSIWQPGMSEDKPRGSFNGKYDNADGLQGSFRAIRATRNKRSVWTVPTSPSALQHFAMMPRKLAEQMLLASCPARVCAACGAPYKRVVQKPDMSERPTRSNGAKTSVEYELSKGWGDRPKSAGQAYQEWRNANPDVTLGFEPSCSCAADVHPGIVIDLFAGTGTTLLEAQKLGFHYVGIDLCAANVELARTRLRYRGDDRRMVREQEAGVEQIALFG